MSKNAASKEWLMTRSDEDLRRLAIFYDLRTVQGIMIRMEQQRRQEADTKMLPVLV